MNPENVEPIIAVALESKYGKENVENLMMIVKSHSNPELATQALLGILEIPELPEYAISNPHTSNHIVRNAQYVVGKMICKFKSYEAMNTEPVVFEYMYESSGMYWYPNDVLPTDVNYDGKGGEYRRTTLPVEQQKDAYLGIALRKFFVKEGRCSVESWLSATEASPEEIQGPVTMKDLYEQQRNILTEFDMELSDTGTGVWVRQSKNSEYIDDTTSICGFCWELLPEKTPELQE